MPIDFRSVDFKAKPDIPRSGIVATSPAPCLKERSRAVEPVADMLGFKIVGSAELPHGLGFGGPDGQVELFAASGAVRARNIPQLSRFEDERRPWADVTRERTKDGSVYALGADVAKRLQAQSDRLLEAGGLSVRPAGVRVVLGQWAQLDEAGKEVDSGPGRATVQYAYEVEGLPLIGAGAKSNIHFDPEDGGRGGVIARMFHVHRGYEGTRDMRLLELEEAFAPLLRQTWSGLESDPRRTRMTITEAEFGLLALPADQPQHAAVPALRIEGTVSGLVPRDGRQITIRFGQYVPLVDPKALADAGLGGVSVIIPGQVVRSERDGGQ